MGEQMVLVIVGAGQAAARAAQAARMCDSEAKIIVFGSEPHLPYERPLLSKALLLNPETPVPFVFAETRYSELDIDVRANSTVISIDREAKTIGLEDGSSVGYDRLLLATGSQVRLLQIPGMEQSAINYLRTLDDCRNLEAKLKARPSMAVVGGGFIGLEVAATAAKMGCAVTVIEAADRLLPRLGCEEASALVLTHHRHNNIDVRLGCGVGRGERGYLLLTDDSEVAADVVVAGIGVSPATALAEAAGLAVDDGILVDEFGTTSDPSIFAAGDVTRHYNPLLERTIRLESWQNANLQAEAAGRAMAGCPKAYQEVPWLWSDQGDLNLQMAGAPAAIDRTIIRGSGHDGEGISIFQIENGHLVGGVTVNRGKDMTMIRRLLAQGELALPVEALADEDIPLRQFAQARQAA